MSAAARTPDPYPPIGEYALIGDCHSAALVSRSGSIDWCCMPRIDRGSQFGRLLDWDRGGALELTVDGATQPATRRYVDETLVLQTLLSADTGSGVLTDCMTMHEGGDQDPHNQILRVIECERGVLECDIHIAPRFDYGGVRPWIRRHQPNLHSAVGGDDGLLIFCDAGLETANEHDLVGHVALRAGQRARLSVTFVRPETLEREAPRGFDPAELDRRLDETIDWWRRWGASGGGPDGPEMAGARRSAIALKAMQNPSTGAIVAAPTTSLPETPAGARNWDYRYSWVRDSAFSARSLAALGYDGEADGFRRFVQRSAAGNAADVQVLYGIGGERRMPEIELDLEGWRGARPVRVGNAASGQLQLDVFGELLNLTWRWHVRGHSPDDDLWRFLLDLVNTAAERWSEPDAGIWEWRGEPQHFVHSKAMCWSALDKGLLLAEDCMRRAPVRRWRKARDEIREAVDAEGFDRERGTFVQAFGSRSLDAVALSLPTFGFVDWNDERMIGTVDAVREGLSAGDGLVRRYEGDDALGGTEGAFLTCSFWLAECLARQARLAEAQEVFDRAVATSNDVGLFSEEYWPETGELIGNFPQALTHLSHIAAAIAMTECRPLAAALSDG